MPVKLCDIKGCPFEGRYCRNHYPGDKPKEKAPIAKLSDKRKKIERKEYQPAANAVKRSGDKACQVMSPVCIKSPVRPHHLAGRDGKNLTDLNRMIRCCDPCNIYIERHSTWAKNHGFKISKHEKNYQRTK